MERGCALLGYVPIGNVGMLLLATRLRSAATLPGGRIMRLVTESRWLQLPLPVRTISHISPTACGANSTLSLSTSAIVTLKTDTTGSSAYPPISTHLHFETDTTGTKLVADLAYCDVCTSLHLRLSALSGQTQQHYKFCQQLIQLIPMCVGVWAAPDARGNGPGGDDAEIHAEQCALFL